MEQNKDHQTEEGPIAPAPFEPDWVCHPGNTITELIVYKWGETHGFTLDELEYINDVCCGYKPITPKLAKRFSELIGVSESFFNNLQNNYEGHCERLGITPNNGQSYASKDAHPKNDTVSTSDTDSPD